MSSNDKELIVSFPWYPFREIRHAHQSFWNELRSTIDGKIDGFLPEKIHDPEDFRSHWSSPRLLLTQCCGYHIATNAHDLQVVAVPDFVIDRDLLTANTLNDPESTAIAPGEYRSVIVKNRRDPRTSIGDFKGARAAFNEDQSYSGHTALFHSVSKSSSDCANFFGSYRPTGSHIESLRAIANWEPGDDEDGDTQTAAIAAIDAISFSIIKEHYPELCASLVQVEFTDRAQAPPYVTGHNRTPGEVEILRDAMVEVSARPEMANIMQAMGMRAIVDATNEDYLPLAKRIREVEAIAPKEYGAKPRIIIAEDTNDPAGMIDGKPLNTDLLHQKLDDHRVWLESECADGHCAHFSGVSIRNADLSGARLPQARIANSNLWGCILRDANLSEAKLTGSNLTRCSAERVNLFNADLAGAQLSLATFSGADLQGANLSGSNLNRSRLDHAYLFGADLRAAKLNGANCRRSNFNQANLNGASLVRTDLRSATLASAKLRGADLERAYLRGAHLQDADLSGANLSGANFDDAVIPEIDGEFERPSSSVHSVLTRTNLRHAHLRDARMTTVDGLQSVDLGGADLTNAQLPEEVNKFEGLRHVEELSKHARVIFLALIGACVFSWLTIGTTTDAGLLTSSASTPLPIIQTKVPIAGFYIAAPVLLLALYFYLHLYLQNLWEGLASLPAVFPDGRMLHQRAYPWLLMNLIPIHVPLLIGSKQSFPLANFSLSIATAWGLVPLTLVAFWVRYLPSHDWVGITLISVTIVISIFSWVTFYWRARATLRDLAPIPFQQHRAALSAGLATAIVAITASAWVFAADTRAKLEVFGYNLYADLRDAEVSQRSAVTVAGDRIVALLEATVGAKLSGKNLRLANAERAFLVNADLSDTDLRAANLFQANLAGAKLDGADLRGANLRGATLTAASLIGTNIAGADLRNVTDSATSPSDLCRMLRTAQNWKQAHTGTDC
tara:strand:+ start:4074 stop:6950 length:2877 start_codon:yes stop_codon:yes gene_type:complete